jgi:uncharacterized protein
MGRFRIDRLTHPPRRLEADGEVVAERCYCAATMLPRSVGLLATPDLQANEALWLERCSSVHAVGLRAPIGVAFLDSDNRVIKVVDPLPRGRVTAARGASSVVECRAGVLARLAPRALLHLG